jgi:squalene synthase HpnC
MARWPAVVARAYAACEALARSHYENFPVASLLLPAAMRPHVAAVYAFARVADDVADEGAEPAAVRQTALSAWQARLHEQVERPGTVEAGSEVTRDDLIMIALAHSIHALDLPISLFDDLISAFGQDTMTSRYDSWHDVFDYCRRSANPVGRLVLRIAGYRSDALDASSDALCTALQLTNLWQDFGRDFRAGRIYVPREAQRASGADEADLAKGLMTPAWKKAIDACVEKTDRQFEIGRAVCDGVSGRLRAELRFTWLGGRRILERVSHEPDLLHGRPTLGSADVPALLMSAVRWPTRRAAVA